MRISIIAAVAENGIIGRGGQLPWRLSADLQRFKRLTMGHAIIMGRRTWESIGRALPGRRSVVVTRQPDYNPGVTEIAVAASLDDALRLAEGSNESEAFIIGGGELYREAILRADRLYFTRVLAKVEGDTRFPEFDWSQWQLTESELQRADEKNDHPFNFEIHERN
jgi:dihydrofolate reductase